MFLESLPPPSSHVLPDVVIVEPTPGARERPVERDRVRRPRHRARVAMSGAMDVVTASHRTIRFAPSDAAPDPARALEMSHGALDAYRDAYARVRVERESWAREHARARALFGAVVNAFERLPALARAMTRKTYGDDVEATFARATVSAQYASLDAMFVGLVEACEGLERVATAMRRAKTDAWRRIDAMEHAPSLGGGRRWDRSRAWRSACWGWRRCGGCIETRARWRER